MRSKEETLANEYSAMPMNIINMVVCTSIFTAVVNKFFEIYAFIE